MGGNWPPEQLRVSELNKTRQPLGALVHWLTPSFVAPDHPAEEEMYEKLTTKYDFDMTKCEDAVAPDLALLSLANGSYNAQTTRSRTNAQPLEAGRRSPTLSPRTVATPCRRASTALKRRSSTRMANARSIQPSRTLSVRRMLRIGRTSSL